jgi:hypothetical protein
LDEGELWKFGDRAFGLLDDDPARQGEGELVVQHLRLNDHLVLQRCRAVSEPVSVRNRLMAGHASDGVASLG